MNNINRKKRIFLVGLKNCIILHLFFNLSCQFLGIYTKPLLNLVKSRYPSLGLASKLAEIANLSAKFGSISKFFEAEFTQAQFTQAKFARFCKVARKIQETKKSKKKIGKK